MTTPDAHITFSAVPGVPQNVRAVEISEPTAENVCLILVQWDPPASSSESDIDNYIVYIPSRNIRSEQPTTISVLRVPNCRNGILFIQVAAVNRGCIGPTSSEVQPSLFDIQTEPTTITPTEAGSTATPTGSANPVLLRKR